MMEELSGQIAETTVDSRVNNDEDFGVRGFSSNIDYGDPLEFTRQIAKKINANLLLEIYTINPNEYYCGRYFIHDRARRGIRNGREISLLLRTRGFDPSRPLIKDEFKGEQIVFGNKPHSLIDLMNDKMSDFEIHESPLIFSLGLNIFRDMKKKPEVDMGLEIIFNGIRSPYLSSVIFDGFSANLNPSKREKRISYNIDLMNFSELNQGDPLDFRPIVHRFLEIYTGVSQERWHDPAIYREQNGLLIPEEKKLVVETKKPNLENAVSDSVDNHDPVWFMSDMIKQLGIDTKGELMKLLPAYHDTRFLDYSLSRESTDAKCTIGFNIFLHDPENPNNEETKKFPKELTKSLQGKGHKVANRFFKPKPRENPMDTFGENKKYVGVYVHFDEIDKTKTKESCSIISLEMVLDSNGKYKINRFEPVNSERQRENELMDCFSDIKSFGISDYRPIIHRILEIYSGLPREEWHNPRMYLPGSVQAPTQEKTDDLVDSILPILFSGKERLQLEKKLADARLKLRRGYASIPRLSLGGIMIPTPGIKDIEKSEFVTTAAPYLIEYISSLGIMTPVQAEALIERKLTHYLVHNSGFQLSATRATEVVSQLRPVQKTDNRGGII